MKAYNCVIRVIEALRTSNIFSENWDMNKKNVNVSCLHTNTGCPVKLFTPVFKSKLCLSCKSDPQMEYLLFFVDKNRGK